MPSGHDRSILEGNDHTSQESPWIAPAPHRPPSAREPLRSSGTARARDGRRSYGLAVLVAVVGATAAALWAVTGFLDQVQRPEQFARTEVPGITSVAITQTGSHVIYVEGTGPWSSGGRSDRDRPAGHTRCRSAPTHWTCATTSPAHRAQLGTAVAVFDADRTGTYQVGTEAVATDQRHPLAVGDDLAPEVIRTVAVPSTIGVLVLLAGIGLALATWIHDERRSRP